MGFWDIDFTYRDNVSVSGGDDLEVTADDPSDNYGTIKFASTTTSGITQGDTFNLVDQDDSNFSFRFNDSENHRLGAHSPPPANTGFFVGWGWLNHAPSPNTPSSHVYSSDWLFTGTLEDEPGDFPVPEATSVVVWSSLAVLGLVWRRKNA